MSRLRYEAAHWLAAILPRIRGRGLTRLPMGLAQYLISAAWQRTRAGEKDVRPWPWADFWPVARLIAPKLGAEAIVAGGLPRRNFKRFGYGATHVWGSSKPGEPGRCVIAAQRAEQIEFLQRMQAGDTLFVETADGQLRTYVVQDAAIRHRRELRAQHAGWQDSLVLVARYEPDIAPEPLHYVVQCAGRAG